MKNLSPLLRSFMLFSILCCQAIAGMQSQAQTSPREHLKELSHLYRLHAIPDTTYLKGVDSAAKELYNDDSLEQWLSTYQEIAFGDPGYPEYRRLYYKHMMRLSDNKNRSGSAIYYAEKYNEEGVRTGLYEKDEIPHSDLFAIATYLENEDLVHVFSKYNEIRGRVEAMPEKIISGAGIASPDGVSMAFAVLLDVGDAGKRAGDTTYLNNAILLCKRMLAEVGKKARQYKEYMVYYHFVYHILCYYRENYCKHTEAARGLLGTCLREVRSPDFGADNDPDGYKSDTYMDAFHFYLDNGKLDSAWYYLHLVRDMAYAKSEFSNFKLSFYLNNESMLLSREGNYKAAYTSMSRALGLKDSLYNAVNADREHNQHALAEEEDAQKKIALAEEKRKSAERFNTWLFAVLGMLVACGVIAFLLFRSRQRQRLLNLQLGLARSFNEEIGPMVKRAGAMAGSEFEADPRPRLEELKNHLGVILEAVRSVSQDLRSKGLSTVKEFSQYLSGYLEKIRATTGIGFAIRSEGNEGKLSHWQFSNLRKMVSELVTNSIKYADCTLISIQVTVEEQRLSITYSDNGKGFSPNAGPGGIGMQNLRERADLLRGEFLLQNNWPEGYSIDILIPLL